MRVEFFGIPRLRAGVSTIDIKLDGEAESLRGVLQIVAAACPEFADSCLVDGWLKTGYVINIDGEEFVSDPDVLISNLNTLIVMSSDAGG